MAAYRVGTGYDAHAFVADRPLILGGVRLPYQQGLAGHSDGDALAHAMIDALLGAAGLGDIGTWFPSEREELRGANSLELLEQVGSALRRDGWSIANLDSVVVAEEPKIQPHVPEIRRLIAHALRLQVEAVSVKATTSDHLGSLGRGEGIACQAIALLERA